MSDTALANWNGTEMPLKDVKVSVLDRAFLFGDAVYEVLRIYEGKLFRPGEHLERLAKSMQSLQIKGIDLEKLRADLTKTLTNSGVSDGIAYIQVTRGEAVRTHRYPLASTPNLLIYVDHFDDPYANGRTAGVSVVTHPDIRWRRNDIKSTSLVANCMAAQYASEHDCAEVMFVNADGYVTEGSHTSIFAVRGGAILTTPASQAVLPGITKKQILQLAEKGGIAITEARLKQSELESVDELFMAGTPEEILAIVRVDDRPVGGGTPGPVTKRLQTEFKKALSDWLRSTT